MSDHMHDGAEEHRRGFGCTNALSSLREWCTGDSRSAEMRYESAWRMGQLQQGTNQSSTVPGRPVGTNEAVLGCLRVSVCLTSFASHKFVALESVYVVISPRFLYSC